MNNIEKLKELMLEYANAVDEIHEEAARKMDSAVYALLPQLIAVAEAAGNKALIITSEHEIDHEFFDKMSNRDKAILASRNAVAKLEGGVKL